MFTCIACRKPEVEDDRDDDRDRKDSVKTLTNQVKDMAVKLSGAYRQCKPCPGSGNLKKVNRPYPNFDAASDGVPYPFFGEGSSTSTPAWNFPSNGAVLGEEWVAQVEPGVHITFVSLPRGGNDLKRIRFSRDMFDKWQAQKWWGENYDRIMELYNVQRFNRQALHTPSRSEDEPRDSMYSKVGSSMGSPTAPVYTPRYHHRPPAPKGYHPRAGSGSGTCTGDVASVESSREEAASLSNASEAETEWVEEDEPGVFITIRQMNDGSRELRRVRFSRERFGEVDAKTWWEQNRERIQDQYL